MIEQLDDPSLVTGRYLADARPPLPDRPWVTLGMISSLDGSAVLDGGSTALGGPADRAVFRALRAVADVVLVGASTVRAEGYRAPRLPVELTEWRSSRGMTPAPRVAIVSNSLDLDLNESLVASRPLVLTSAAADPARRRGLGVDVVECGTDRVDLRLALATLRRMGVERVTLEGGPQLNGQMLGLIDEASVTIAPLLAGGDGLRMVMGGSPERPLTVDRVILSDGFLLVRALA